ncbi:MAG: hypothetical protein AAF196_04810 [Planctomycetota bacterium]
MTLELLRKQAVALLVLALGASSCATPDDNTDTSSDPSTTRSDDDPAGGGSSSIQDPTLTAENQSLFESRLDQATRLLGEGTPDALANARVAVDQALALSPNDSRARGLRSQILEAQGQDAENVQLPTYDDIQRVRAERNRVDVETRIEAAKNARDEGDFSAALRAINEAELAIDSAVDVDWQGLDDEVEAMRERLVAERDASTAQAREEQVARTIADLNAEKDRRDRIEDEQVQALLDQALRAFDRNQYELARDLAAESLSVKRTAEGLELHDLAMKATRDRRTESQQRLRAGRLRQLELAIASSRIPTTDTLSLDLEVWERAQRRGLSTRQTVVTPEDLALRERLSSETLSGLTFDEDSGLFEEVFSRVSTISNLAIVTTAEAQTAIEDEEPALVLELTAPMTLENFFDRMVATTETLDWTVKNGVVFFQTKEESGGDAYLDTKDVRDLIFAKTNFIAPKIDEIPNGEDFDGPPRTGGEDEEPVVSFELDQLLETITASTDATYWEEGGGQLEGTENGFLLVRANPEKQAEVDRILEDFRRFATTVVTLESRFLSVQDNYLQEIGVDWRGLGGTSQPSTVATLDDTSNGLDDNAGQGLDNGGTGDPAGNPAAGVFFDDGLDGSLVSRTENFFSDALGTALSSTGGLSTAISFLDDFEIQAIIEAVEKEENIRELDSQIVTVQNNEQGYVSVINQTTYVRDFEVEVALAAFIADPRTDVVQDGVVLQVRPTVLHNRKQVLLQLQPTVATLALPIPTFSTSLAGTTTPVTLQLPVLEVNSFATTVVVPDGASLLIGGLREIRSTERKASTPILGDIPILSFFFSQQGVSDEQSSLMVMVTAKITDVRDAVERLTRR